MALTFGHHASNEPANQWNQPSMLMSASQQIAFINEHLAPISIPVTSRPRLLLTITIMTKHSLPYQRPSMRVSYVDGAAFHIKRGSISALTTVKEATGKNVYFTEQYTDVNGDFNGDMGWHMENVLIGSLNNWSKCVLEWNLAQTRFFTVPTRNLVVQIVGALPSRGNAIRHQRLVLHLGHFQILQPDAVRITWTTSSSKLLLLDSKILTTHLQCTGLQLLGGLDDAEDIELVIGSKNGFYHSATSIVTFAVNNR